MLNNLNELLNGRTAVITGAAQGIGLTVANAFAAAGAAVAAVDIANSEFTCDVSDFAQVKAVCADILAKHGKVDILVNNAGITKDGLLLAMKEEDFDKVLAVNLKGAFNFTKQLSRPLMKSANGRIINMASVIGVNGNAGQANYAASKAGLIGFTKSVAKELASRGVTVNAIAPGFIQSKMTEEMPAAAKEKALANIPLQRLGTTADVAALATFLASDFAAYITGEVIKVDGGLFI
ncbi:MAG: 3-oxoacyl-ACP reductase FabG [Defluviitaleaceae bacterium]|nr:3-oxoacyl-ACP reductase FabG [Defluviitaleaceae bacterium]